MSFDEIFERMFGRRGQGYGGHGSGGHGYGGHGSGGHDDGGQGSRGHEEHQRRDDPRSESEGRRGRFGRERGDGPARTVACPSCRSDVIEGARFCQQCGHSLQIEARQCARCGLELPPSAQFCIQCGAALGARGDAAEPGRR